jgi:hypothetical protein
MALIKKNRPYIGDGERCIGDENGGEKDMSD